MHTLPAPPPVPQTDRCPLCGGPNRCAVAAGLPPSDCWCMQARLDAEALARIPADARGLRCVCAACGQPPGPDEASGR